MRSGKYPEIVIIGTAGPFCEGSDYTEGWNLATELGMEIIDEHYYQSPGWFLNNQDYYDHTLGKRPKFIWVNMLLIFPEDITILKLH